MRAKESRLHRGCRAAAVGAVASLAAAAAAQPSLVGLSLEDAIGLLEDDGLRVFYSSDLVRPGMRVLSQPSGGDARDWLRTVLAPHGLTTESGPRGSLLIVAASASVDVVADAAAALPLPSRDAAPRDSYGSPAIDELVVAGSRYELSRAIDAPFRFESADLEALPDLGDDSLRAMQRLPGTAADGFSARANVRGGEVGETLIRLDQLRLYEPYHLEDFQSVFSSIDPRIVSTMEVYTGGFPAAFGDRLSGVIDVASLVPPAERYHEVGVSFFNASVLSAGRFAADDGEWLVSARRSNLDLLYSAFSAQPERPRYLDAFGKVAYRLGDSLRVSANALYSRDDVTLSDDLDVEEQARSRHEDRYAWLRLEHTLSTGLQGATLLAHATLSGERFGESDKEGISRGWLTDRRDFTIDSLQSDWTWQPAADRWLVRFGGLLGRSSGAYDYQDSVEFDLLFDAAGAPTEPVRERSVSAAPRGEQHALYGSLSYRPIARLMLDLGLRWDHQTLDPGHNGSVGPRLGLSYRVGERTLLRASGGRFEQSQAINELQVSDGVEEFFAPQQARHTVLAVEHDFLNGPHLRIEAYEKEMRRLRPRYEDLLYSLSLLPELKPDRVRVAPDSAAARGVEVLITDGRAARLDWWASYGYGRVRDRIAGVDVPRSWDQTHTLSGGVSFETLRWSASLAATYRSGWPTTAVLDLSTGGAVPIVITGPRNGERVDAFRSVDMKITRTFALQRSELSVFLELSNAFDYHNDCCTEYEISSEPSGEPWLELSPSTYLPRVPSIGFVWVF